jgi:hypothetical protein
VSSTRTTYRSSFSQPLTSSIALGVLLTGGLYALMLTESLNNPLLRRFCFSHWTAGASITLFCVAIVFLATKLWMAVTQHRLTTATVGALNSLIHDGRDVLPAERPRWLEASWLSLPVAWQYSWFGVRLNRILTLQLKRGRRDSLEQDLEFISQADSQRQRESFSFVRTVVCAMPILGILGTAISFGELERIPAQPTPQLPPSQTAAASAVLIATPSATSAPQTVTLSPSSSETTLNLAKNASKPLETLSTLKPQSAMDTTALALVLTLATLLVQLIVFRTERDLLEQIDMGVQDTLIEYLAADPHDAEENLLAPVKQMSADLVATIHQIVEQQATIWSRSIAESQRQWSTWTQAASECIASNLTETITEALKNHASRLEKIQDEGSRQIDTRWQQWQTTLSDQARAMSSQQKELIRQTDSIQQLVSATTDLRKLEETILESVGRLENIHRLEDASQCVGEAVAVLATSLERAGIIRGAPVRPRVVRRPDAADTLASVECLDTEKAQQRKSA